MSYSIMSALRAGTGAPYAVEILETDTAYLLDSTLPQPAERLSPAESSEQPEVRTESL